MRGKTVNSAIVLLIVGNALAVISDVFVKVMGAGAPVFQFVFIRSVLTVVLLLPFYRQLTMARPFQGLGVHALRSHLHLIGIACMVVALTSMPLATANAVFYVSPLLVMILAALLFRERLTLWSMLAVISGFLGILVILRPTEFSWVALSALGAALALALNALLVRRLPTDQSTVHKLYLNYLLMLPVAALAMWWEGAAWNPAVLISALGSAIFILGYNITVLLAYRVVAANQVTSAEYTGLIWAIAIGWIWFAEAPDLWFVVGSAMIVVPLILLGMQHRQRIPAQSHTLADDRLREQ